MARGIYFSGDLVGLNQGMDSEERNRIASRTGNQAFLANLAGTTIGNATARRGQDTQERMVGMETDSRERIAGRNADVASQGNRFNFDAAMARNATDRERIGAALDEIRQRESEGLRVDERAKKALEAAALDNAAQRATMEKIAQINADASTGRLSSQGERAMFEQNAAIDDFNMMADATANAANLAARKNTSWFGPEFKTVTSQNELNKVYMGLPLEQQAMLQIVPATDANGKEIPGGGVVFKARSRPKILPPGQAPLPGAPAPAPAPGPGIFNPTNSVGPLNLTNAPAGTNMFSGLLQPPQTQFTNAPATNRVIQAPRVVTPLSDIERGRRMPTNQVMAPLMPTNQVEMAEEDPYAGWVPTAVPFPYEDAPIPERMMGPEQTAALRGDPSLDGRLRRGYGSFPQAILDGDPVFPIQPMAAPMPASRPVFATPPIAAPRSDRGFPVMGETPLEIAIRKFGRNSATEGLLNKLRRQPAQ
jgi:hypothetical protein